MTRGVTRLLPATWPVTPQITRPCDAGAGTRDGDTLLRGAVTDQAALHGVLAQVEALGLELLEVRRLPAAE